MADTLSGSFAVSVTWLYQNSLDLSTPVDSKTLKYSDDFTDGTGADQADVIWHDQRTVSASSNDDLDLAGSLTNSFGATVTFAKVKGIYIQNTNTTAGDIITVGGEGSNEFSTPFGADGDKVKIGPGGVFALYDPSAAAYAVTAGTDDKLRISETGGANAAVYNIVIIGTTA